MTHMMRTVKCYILVQVYVAISILISDYKYIQHRVAEQRLYSNAVLIFPVFFGYNPDITMLIVKVAALLTHYS